MRVAALLAYAVTLGRRSLGWLAARAVGRAITPGSLSGISVLMAVCAAGWFSGGAGEDGARGLLAMSGWLLFGLASRGLAAFIAHRLAGRAAAGAPDRGTDWLVLPARWPGDAQATMAGRNAASQAPLTAGARLADEAPAGGGLGVGEAAESDAGAGAMLGFGWLAAISAMAAESAIYGGMAAGTVHATLIGAWPLAVLTVAAVVLTDVLGACRAAALTAERSMELGRNPVLRAVGTLLRVPPGLRGLLALAAYGLGGPQAALLAVLALGVVAIAAAIATLATVVPARGAALTGPDSSPAASPRSAAATPARITAIVGVAGSPGDTTAVQFTATPSPAWLAASRPRAASAPGGQSASRGPGGGGARAAVRAAAAPAAQCGDIILALRDDGGAARWAGRLVQGNLIPLPPALAGLIATAMLAALGLRHLPGFIALTPPVVMMLASPGSGHPHDSRFDWLVPVLLAAVQFVYLGSLGFALALPGPVVFAACGLVATWYASNTAIATRTGATRTGAAAADTAGSGAWGAGLGWEARMFVVGLAATFGLATFGYVGLAAYLGVLICRKVVTGYLVPREEDRR